MKIGLSLTAFTQGAGGISITINGLTGGNAVAGDHASITMTASSGTITARKWGSTPGGSEYGTGTSPTDFTAGEGGALYATATVGGSDYSSSASIVFAAPVASGGIADQSYAQDSAISTLDVSSDFTGSGITYALAPSSASLPAGLSLASNGQITGTPTAEAAQVNIVVRGTNSGGFDDTAFGVTITAAVSNVTTTFGALTLEGAGGVAVTGTSISSGDASGHWQISGGEISPSATGAGSLSGPYSLVLDDGQEVSITTVADTYTVKPLGAQIDAANVDHVTNRVAASTIAIRPGNITDGTTGDAGAGFLDERTWLNRDYSTKRLTITSVDDNNRAEFRDWRALVQGSNNIRFEGVVFRQTGTSFEGSFISDGGVSTTAIQIVDCEFYGRALDYTLDWYANPETGYSGTNRPRLPTGFVLANTVGATIEDNIFQGLYLVGDVLMQGTVSMQRNTASLCYYDLYNMTAPSSEDSGLKTIKDNVGWGVFGARWDVGPGPHGDGFQHKGQILNNAVFENNWIGMGQVGTTHNGDDQQTWFGDAAPEQRNVVFLRNLFTGQALHGITCQKAVNVVIDQCTVMEADPENPVGQMLKPTVNITNFGTGVRHVRDTITASAMNLGSGNIDDNNVVVATSGGDYTVSASFEGGTFGAETLADALAAFTPKAAGSVTGLGAVTTAGAFRTGARPPAASPAPSLSASGTTLTVTVADTIWNGGSAVTSQDIRYSTDEATWTTVTGVTSPHDITGLTAGTLYYVQTRDNNAAGTGTAWSASQSETMPSAGTIAYEGVQTTVSPGTTTVTWTSAASGAGRYIIGLNTRAANLPTVTLAGASATALGSGVSSATNQDKLRFYDVTTTGSGDLVCTYGAAPTTCQTWLWSVPSGISVAGLEEGSANSGTEPFAVACVGVEDADELFIIINRNGGGTNDITATSGWTRDASAQIGSTSYGAAGRHTKVGAGDHTATVNFNGSTSGDEILLMIAVTPA